MELPGCRDRWRRSISVRTLTDHPPVRTKIQGNFIDLLDRRTCILGKSLGLKDSDLLDFVKIAGVTAVQIPESNGSDHH